MTPEDIIATLGLSPLPVEGGWFGPSARDEHVSVIHYLLRAGECSALHRLDRGEVFTFHAGAPARMLLLDPVSGTVERPVLGVDLAAGQRPQVAVPAGVWQGTVPLGDWSLLGCVVAPPYTDDAVEFADPAALAARFPAVAEDITALAPLDR